MQDAGLDTSQFDPKNLHERDKETPPREVEVYRLQRAVVGFITGIVMDRYDIPQHRSLQVGNAMNEIWQEHYSELFRENCCRDDKLKLDKDIFDKLPQLDHEGQLDLVMRKLGFEGGFEQFFSRSRKLIREALVEEEIIPAINKEINGGMDETLEDISATLN